MSFKEMMLSAPAGQIDQPLMDIIKKWEDTPTAANLLEAIDFAIYYAATSGFVLSIWQSAYEAKPDEEKSKAMELAKTTWRTQYS